MAETRVTGKRICAWCGAYLGPAPGVAGETRGICDSCLTLYFDDVSDELLEAKGETESWELQAAAEASVRPH